MTCYELSPGTPAPQTLAVTAGSSLTFNANTAFSHPGPVNVYLAKAPSTAAAFDGKGPVWFKIYEEPAKITSSGISWGSYSMYFYFLLRHATSQERYSQLRRCRTIN